MYRFAELASRFSTRLPRFHVGSTLSDLLSNERRRTNARSDSSHEDGSARAIADASFSRGTLLPFLAIALFAFAIRYVYLVQARAVPMFDGLIQDGESYFAWSDKIVAGDWLGDQVFYQAPLYPYFLAVVKLVVGKSLWSIRIVQIALGSASCGVLFLAGKRYFSRAAGIAAGVILALYPPAIFFDGCIQKANLGLVWTVSLLFALACATQRSRERTESSAPPNHPLPRTSVTMRAFAAWLAAGAMLGLLMLTREETILLAPVVAAWIFVALRKQSIGLRARWIGAWIIGLVLALSPVALRNYKVGGELVLTTSQAGSNFYIGNNPRATGTYVPLIPGRSNVAYERRDAVDLAEQAVGHSLTPKEVSSYWFARSFDFIRGEPSKWLGLMLTKVNLALNAYESPDAEDQYFYERYVPLLAVLGSVLTYGVILPLAAAGWVLTWRRREELSILHVVLATLYTGVVLFYVFARYRYPVVPILVLFAGAAIVEGFARLRARSSEQVWPASIALAATAIVSNNWVHPKDWQLWEQYSNSGVTYSTRGDDENAVEMFHRALAIEPSKAEVWGNLGVSLQNLKRHEESAAAFQRALELRPGDARAEARLGKALWLGGRARDGAVHLSRAVALAPGNGEYWSVYGKALADAGESRAAIDALRRAHELWPSDVATAARLAWELATSPDASSRDPKTAVAIGEEAVRKSKEPDAAVLDALSAAYAELGRFPEAVAAAQKALDAARRASSSIAPEDVASRLELFRRGEPFRRVK
jgi:tetratricopeptide (TPR) repeat protein